MGGDGGDIFVDTVSKHIAISLSTIALLFHKGQSITGELVGRVSAIEDRLTWVWENENSNQRSLKSDEALFLDLKLRE